MSGYVEMGRVIHNTQIGSDVWRMSIYAPKQAKEAQLGQFCNVRVTGGTGFDVKAGTIDLLYRVVGKGTELMTKLQEGDTLDCLGPLGQAFTTADRMLLVGGGVGIAPMLCIADRLQPGQEAHVILGFRNASESFWADLFKDSPVTVHITTDDGSLGTKGYPTTVMETLMKEEQFDAVLTCGPTPMMKGVAAVAQQMEVPCQVSLEERMGCGTGGCVGCACQGKSGTRYKVCKDGPVFPAEEVFY